MFERAEEEEELERGGGSIDMEESTAEKTRSKRISKRTHSSMRMTPNEKAHAATSFPKS